MQKVRPTRIAGNIAHSRGKRMFVLTVTAEDGHADIKFQMTPQQWAEAMWGCGDIVVDAMWTEES